MVFGTSSTTTVSVTPTHISPMIFEGMRLMKAQGGFKNKAPAANGAAIIWKKKMKEVKHWKGVRKYDISERMGEGGGVSRLSNDGSRLTPALSLFTFPLNVGETGGFIVSTMYSRCGAWQGQCEAFLNRTFHSYHAPLSPLGQTNGYQLTVVEIQEGVGRLPW